VSDSAQTTTTPVTAHAPRTYGIDLLRGIACASVLCFHYLSRGPREGWIADAFPASVEAIARYGYLGVHLFFMVSGYVILLSAEGRTPREFVASRVARLYPALWVAATLTMLVIIFVGPASLRVSWPEYLWNLTLIPQYVGARFVDGAYWSLAVELQFYILVWITLRTRLIAWIEPLLWAWLLLSIVDALRPIYPAEKWLIAQWAPCFVIGASTYRIVTRGWSAWRLGLLLTAAVCALWQAMLEIHRLARDWGGPGPLSGVAAAVLGVAMVLFLVFGLGLLRIGKTRWATIPGNLTYPVYLVHQNIGYALFGVLAPLTAILALRFVLVTLIVTLVGWFLHRWVERPLSPRLRRFVAGATRP
jgi:peptidoglycan/LPS O-acetylase OafA/YrhL